MTDCGPEKELITFWKIGLMAVHVECWAEGACSNVNMVVVFNEYDYKGPYARRQ